jgi:hypothetical protein
MTSRPSKQRYIVFNSKDLSIPDRKIIIDNILINNTDSFRKGADGTRVLLTKIPDSVIDNIYNFMKSKLEVSKVDKK